MWDLMLIAGTGLFFAVAAMYVRGCERLRLRSGGHAATSEASGRP